MDSVRFGRVLGKGARAAARGLYEAVDAATAPNPNPSPKTTRPASQRPAQTPIEVIAQGAAVYTEQKKMVTREAGKLGKSVFAPFAKAGRALWLEVTGSFFALFAVIFVGNMWKYRAGMRLNEANADVHHHFLIAAVAAVVFGYFAVTSFMRARRPRKVRA